MVIAVGIAKQLRYKKETTWGVAPGATGAQLLRRVTSDLDLKKETYQSNEIRSDYQVADFRHGVRMVDGGINGELSPGTYEDFLAAAVRQDWQTAATTGAIATVASNSAGTFTRSAGSFLTAGFKIGDVIRWTGWTAPATANNSRNFLITNLTATVMTGIFLDGTVVITKAEGDTVTGVVVGKKTWVPNSGHTDESFAIEHFYSDIAQSELFTGCKVNTCEIQLPATGLSTINMQFMGKDVTTGTSAYYTSPTAETSSGVFAAVNGYLYVGGVQVGLVTGLNFTLNGNMTAEAVVGSNVRPDIFEGRVTANGQFTAFFQDATFRDYFLNESEISLLAVLTTGNTAAADFMVFNFPRIKLGNAAKDDGEKGLVQTIPFQALKNVSGGALLANLDTTFSVQDSLVS